MRKLSERMRTVFNITAVDESSCAAENPRVGGSTLPLACFIATGLYLASHARTAATPSALVVSSTTLSVSAEIMIASLFLCVRRQSWIGSSRTRFPVAANIAFVTAGATGASGPSPRPLGESSLSTKWTSISGMSSIRQNW